MSIVLKVKNKLQKKVTHIYPIYVYMRHILSNRAKLIQLVSPIAITEYISIEKKKTRRGWGKLRKGSGDRT